MAGTEFADENAVYQLYPPKDERQDVKHKHGYPGIQPIGNERVIVQELMQREIVAEGEDNTNCIYALACLSFFIFPPFVLIAYCIYNCGKDLGPQQRIAWRTMLACAFTGFFIWSIFWIYVFGVWL